MEGMIAQHHTSSAPPLGRGVVLTHYAGARSARGSQPRSAAGPSGPNEASASPRTIINGKTLIAHPSTVGFQLRFRTHAKVLGLTRTTQSDFGLFDVLRNTVHSELLQPLALPWNRKGSTRRHGCVRASAHHSPKGLLA